MRKAIERKQADRIKIIQPVPYPQIAAKSSQFYDSNDGTVRLLEGGGSYERMLAEVVRSCCDKAPCGSIACALCRENEESFQFGGFMGGMIKNPSGWYLPTNKPMPVKPVTLAALSPMHLCADRGKLYRRIPGIRMYWSELVESIKDYKMDDCRIVGSLKLPLIENRISSEVKWHPQFLLLFFGATRSNVTRLTRGHLIRTWKIETPPLEQSWFAEVQKPIEAICDLGVERITIDRRCDEQRVRRGRSLEFDDWAEGMMLLQTLSLRDRLFVWGLTHDTVENYYNVIEEE